MSVLTRQTSVVIALGSAQTLAWRLDLLHLHTAILPPCAERARRRLRVIQALVDQLQLLLGRLAGNSGNVFDRVQGGRIDA